MKLKEGFLLREVAGSNIVVPVGKAELDFGGMLTLNHVGAFIWNQLSEDTTEEKIVKAVLDAYEIDEATARCDTHAFLEKMRQRGLLED